MKRLVALLILVLMLSGCGAEPETVIGLDEIDRRVVEENCTAFDFSEELFWKSRDTLIACWGEPDRRTSYEYEDIWDLDSGKYISIWYDENWTCESIDIKDS